MTTKELLEEYARLYGNAPIVSNGRTQKRVISLQMEEIIQELEASIRKEVVEEILQWGYELTSYHLEEGVRQYALSKGIKLK